MGMTVEQKYTILLADKRQVQDMLKMLLNLPVIPQPDDAADALGLAVYGALQCQMLTKNE
jgi:crossover junction endodeoxyribonuclease RuvC